MILFPATMMFMKATVLLIQIKWLMVKVKWRHSDLSILNIRIMVIGKYSTAFLN